MAGASLWALSSSMSTAYAQCAPDPAQDGDTVVCTGVEPDGVVVTASDVSFTVEDDATLSFVVIEGANNSFLNRGDITNNDFTPGGVVTLRGISGISNPVPTAVVNEGEISSDVGSTSALHLSEGVFEVSNREGALLLGNTFAPTVFLGRGFEGKIVNDGFIRNATRAAIVSDKSFFSADLAQAVTIINSETGVIESGNDFAIIDLNGNPLNLINSGLITSNGFAVVAASFSATVRNETSGVIDGADGAAINANSGARIVNEGQLKGVDQAINGAGFFLENAGEIIGDVSGGFSAIENSGVINGSILLGGSVYSSIENSGIITGAIEDNQTTISRDVFRDFGGEIAGGVSLGSGDDFVLVKTGVARGSAPFIDTGDGLDSFGYSVEAVENVVLEQTNGFEGFAVEARFKDSEARLLLEEDAPFTQTVSLFGEGTIVNTASIFVNGEDAIRLLSVNDENRSFLANPFGSGVTFINEGVIEASNAVAIRALPGANGFAVLNADERVENRNVIIGDVVLDNGNDIFINAGVINGNIDLGEGDDVFVTDILQPDASLSGTIQGGPGIDAIGFYTSEQASTTLSISGDFEAAAAFADGVDARLDILEAPGEPLSRLRVYGTGVVSNRQPIVNNEAGIFNNPSPAVEVISSGARFENNASLDGSTGILLRGDGQTVTNNVALTRERKSGDSTGNLGFITDIGVGNTIINNSTISVTAFSTAAIFIGDSTFFRFGENDPNIDQTAVTRVINNGELISSSFGGALRLSTNLPVAIENNGFISDVEIRRSEGGVTLFNSSDAEIGFVSVNGTSFPDDSEGPITIINEGLIGSDDVRGGVFFRAQGWAPPGTGPGVADAIVNAGRIIGDIDFSGGEDSFTVLPGGTVEGLIDGGTETDTVFFSAFSGDVVVDQFRNFEYLDISTNGRAVIGDNIALDDAFTDLFVREGLTAVETNLALDVTVLNDGILGGNGAIIGDVVNFGAISPGASIGALTINGDLSLNPASVLEIEFDQSGNDALIVNGDVVINGATLLLTSLGDIPTSPQAFQFLSADSVSGDFEDLAFTGFTGVGSFEDLGGGLFGVAFTPQFEITPALSANALSSATYLNNIILLDVGTSDSDEVVSSLFGLTADPNSFQNALLSLQPEAFAATAAIGVEHSFLATDLIRGRAGSFSKRADGKYFWLSGAGGFARYEGDLISDGASSFKVNNRGFIGGAEIVRNTALVGLYGGSLRGKQEFRSGIADTETDGFIIGGYGALSSGPLRTNASFGYIVGDAETVRSALFLAEQFRSDYDSDAFTAQAQSQYELNFGELDFAPFVGLTYIRTDREAVFESGGAAALDVADQVQSFLYADIGGKAAKRFEINDHVTLDATFSAGWRYETLGHSIETDASISGVSLSGLRGAAVDFERSQLIIGGDFSVRLGKRTEIFARYRGEYGEDYTDNSVNGGLAIQF